MTKFSVQGPTDGLIQFLESNVVLFSNVSQDRMNSLGLVVFLFTLCNIFRSDTTLGKINVT